MEKNKVLHCRSVVQTSGQRGKVDTKLSASALELTIVVSLVIAILLASLITLYTFCNGQTERLTRRFNILHIMDSATTLAQSNSISFTDTMFFGMVFKSDTVEIKKTAWGLYDLGIVKVRDDVDSLRRAFLLGESGSDTTVLYIADEDRNLSVSGKTRIVGNAFLPQSGIKPAFVDSKYYDGKEGIVDGQKRFSERELPVLEHERVQAVYNSADSERIIDFKEQPRDLSQSFFMPTAHWYDKEPIDLSDYNLKGNIVISSDTAIHIGSVSSMTNIICIAPFISIDDGFKGTLQLFATDSISIGQEVVLEYPSAVVLKPVEPTGQSKINIKKLSHIYGTVMLADEKKNNTPHRIEFGEGCTVVGDLLAYGMLQYEKALTVYGSTYCYRFITRTPSSLYENYLIDIDFDRTRLPADFLHSYVWRREPEQRKNKIATWLE